MKMKLRTTLIGNAFLQLSLFLLASCGGGGGGSPAPSSSVIVTACTGTISAEVFVATFVPPLSYGPTAVTINVNEVVRWSSASGVDHNVTSTTVPANGSFSALLPHNSSVCLKFTAPGDFNYYCSIHPSMTGKVTVN